MSGVTAAEPRVARAMIEPIYNFREQMALPEADRYYSALDHGTICGLGQSVEWQPGTPLGADGVQLVSRSEAVISVLTGVVLGYGHAALAHLQHRGWDAGEFTQHHKAAVDYAVAHLPHDD